MSCTNSNTRDKLVGNWKFEYSPNDFSYISFTQDSVYGYVRASINIRMPYEVYGDTIYFIKKKDMKGFRQNYSLIISAKTDTLILDNGVGHPTIYVKTSDSPIPEIISK